jgi:hypothetical protein
MEMLTIEINNPRAKRLIDDLADLELISVKAPKPSWNERWRELSKSLPDFKAITEQDVMDEVSAVRMRP